MNNLNNNNNGDIVNVASYLKRMARVVSYKKAVIQPSGKDKQGRISYSHLTFLQLDQESDSIAHGLEQSGIRRGTRTIVMVRPCLDFFSLIFALFKVGAVPVIVDPGMGLKRMLQCLKESDPEAFIGIPLAHALRVMNRKYFRAIKTWITVGKRWFWGGATLEKIKKVSSDPYEMAKTEKDEIAAILFTTGSTGPAKGVIYTHGIFDAQIKHIKTHFEISTDEIDLPTFPLFALFDPALGMTAVIPDMDSTKPGFVDPEKIIRPIIDHGVTNMFASPALLNRVGSYGKKAGIKLPSLKRIISAGAPVTPANLEQFSSMLTGDAQIHSGYGATEAMPVISIGSKEILAETKALSEKGNGMCIGVPINSLKAKIIKIIEKPIEKWSDDLLADQDEIGEITVKGDVVTQQYYKRPDADAISKIRDNGSLWHRMGDLGKIDEKGRFWFCGRKSHRVITDENTLFTIPCEAIFNNHPDVFRTALVGIGEPARQKPVLCVELKNGIKRKERKKLENELKIIGQENEITKDIDTILFHESFPVDIRHNSKIFREKLAVWAEQKLLTAG